METENFAPTDRTSSSEFSLKQKNVKAASPSKKDRWQQVTALFHQALEQKNSSPVLYLESLDLEQDMYEEVMALLQVYEQDQTGATETIQRIVEKGAENVLSETQKDFAEGESVGDFLIVRIIGEGALAKVYLAQQKSLQRMVALKVSPPIGEEGKILASLEHPHIVKVFTQTKYLSGGSGGSGSTGSAFVEPKAEKLLVSMQYIEGVSLQEVLDQPQSVFSKAFQAALARKGLKPEVHELIAAKQNNIDALAYFDSEPFFLNTAVQLADALQYAHSKAVMHSDIKPSNVFLSAKGDVFLMDFNVSLSNTQQGVEAILGGTKNYMSPEQQAALGSKDGRSNLLLDHRIDIFSLGRTLQRWREKFHGKHFLIDRVLKKASMPDREQRYLHVNLLAHELRMLQSANMVKKRLPRLGVLSRACLRYPLCTFFVATLVPQCIGSVVNFVYNHENIVSAFSAAQLSAFQLLALVYNPFAFAVGISVYLFLVRKPIQLLRRLHFMPTRLVVLQEQGAAELRHLFPRILSAVLVITSLLWITGGLVFPWGVSFLSEPVSMQTHIYFYSSFLLSWLVSGAYSIVTLQWFFIRVLLPQLIDREETIAGIADELDGSFLMRSQLFTYATSMTPLVSALILLQLHIASPVSLSLLIVLGCTGLVFSFQAVQQMEAVRAAFHLGEQN